MRSLLFLVVAAGSLSLGQTAAEAQLVRISSGKPQTNYKYRYDVYYRGNFNVAFVLRYKPTFFDTWHESPEFSDPRIALSWLDFFEFEPYEWEVIWREPTWYFDASYYNEDEALERVRSINRGNISVARMEVYLIGTESTLAKDFKIDVPADVEPWIPARYEDLVTVQDMMDAYTDESLRVP